MRNNTPPIKIAICDDSVEDSDQIRDAVEQYLRLGDYHVEICSFKGTSELLAACNQEKFGIFILDIMMDDLNGIQVAKEIRKTFSETPIIFASSSREYAVESYEIGAAYYILKPVTPEKLAPAFLRCQNVLSASRKYLDVMADRETVRVYEKDVVFAEAFGNRVVLHTARGDVSTYTPLDKLMQSLGDSFLRCHRSFFVNMLCVGRVNGREFVLKTGETIPIRTNGRAEVLQQYNRFLVESLRR